MHSIQLRRHDVDALRALAFLCLIFYHIGMLYVQNWGWHIKSSYQWEWLWVPMFFMNRWRMDLIFLIAGIATAMMMQKSDGKSFIRERSTRLLLPLFFGVLVIVPIQPYCQGVLNGKVEPGFLAFLGNYFTGYKWPENAFDGWQYGFTWNHLWYLPYVFFYTLVIFALRRLLTSGSGGGASKWFRHLKGARLLIWPFVPIIAFTLLLEIRFPTTHDLVHDWYMHSIYFTMFLYGWWIGRDNGLWTEFGRLRQVSLLVALMSFAVFLTLGALHPRPITYSWLVAIWTLRSLYIWAMLAAILGYTYTYLNRPFQILPWATSVVYPWYVLHQSIIVLLAYWLVPLKIGAWLEVPLVVAGTLVGCWAITAGVSRIPGIRPLLGMKR